MSTILIIDDDPRFRGQVRELLGSDGFTVIGEAVDGASGIAAAGSLRPAIVLLDIGLPDIEGFAVAQALARLAPPPAIVLMSSRDSRAYGRRLANAPVVGFIPKEQLSGDTLRSLVDGA